LRDQLQLILDEMKKNYTYLTNMQAQAITSNPDEQFNNDLLKTYSAITKQDVLLANYIIRAKSIKSSKAGSSGGGSCKGGRPSAKKEKKEKKDKKDKKEPKAPKSKKKAD
ncbi:unnamed protein product, partial [Symbiodinium sp. CCMP2592]